MQSKDTPDHDCRFGVRRQPSNNLYPQQWEESHHRSLETHHCLNFVLHAAMTAVILVASAALCKTVRPDLHAHGRRQYIQVDGGQAPASGRAWPTGVRYTGCTLGVLHAASPGVLPQILFGTLRVLPRQPGQLCSHRITPAIHNKLSPLRTLTCCNTANLPLQPTQALAPHRSQQ